MVKNRSHGESDECPDAAEQPDVSPAAVRSNELTPKNRRAKRNDREDQDTNVDASLACWSKFGCHGQRGEFVDTGSHASN